MLKYMLVFLMMGQALTWAEPAKADTEIALDDLFSDEDLSALKDEEELLFDEISQGEVEADDLDKIFQ